MVDLIQNYGFTKKTDLVSYKISVPEASNNSYEMIYQRALRNNKDLKIVNFSKRKLLKQYVKPVLELLNQTFKNIYAFNPLSDKEMDEFADRYLMILDPRFIKVIENQKKGSCCFCFGCSRYVCGDSKKQRIYLAHRIYSNSSFTKENPSHEPASGGYQGKITGIKVLIPLWVSKCSMGAQKRGIKYIDSHLILENNLKMQR